MSTSPVTRTAQAAAACDEERKVCTREAGKGERWVMAGIVHILQLSKHLKLLTEMVGREEAPSGLSIAALQSS